MKQLVKSCLPMQALGGDFGVGIPLALNTSLTLADSVGGAVSADLGISAALEVSGGAGDAGFKVSAGLGWGPMPVESEVSSTTTTVYNVIGDKYILGSKCFDLPKVESSSKSQTINIPSDPIPRGWNNESPM